MSSGNWLNNDGLQLEFGTAKTTAEVAGEFVMPGESRVAEVDINWANVSTGANTIISYNYIFPAQSGTGSAIQIDKVVQEVETAVSGSGTVSVGVIGLSQSSGTATTGAFINAQTTAGLTTAGITIQYTTGSTAAGSVVGSYAGTSFTTPMYITAQASSGATGTTRVRIYYHGVGTISN